MDVYKHLSESETRIDFTVNKCTELPELNDDSGSEFGGNWRSGDDFGGGGGGNGY